jgi:dTDP-4-dehydrorhamnose reductase
MGRAEIFVLGHKGMLGSAVARYLAEVGFSIRTTDTRFGGTQQDALIDEVRNSDSVAVLNCVGTTEKRAQDIQDLYVTNALLPQRLAVALGADRLLIHASSDGVFDGLRGSYLVTDETNATDSYGASKRLGELAVLVGRVAVIRCSIVGLDQTGSRGLLSWFLDQRGAVTGHSDYLWNGITTLEWAKVAARIIRGEVGVGPGIHQPASGVVVSKCQILETAARVFNHDIPVIRGRGATPIDRTLVPTITCPTLFDQLRELHTWQPSGSPGGSETG